MDIKRISDCIRQIIPRDNILLDEPMKNHTSFRIGGNADIMVMPSAKEQIIDIIKLCKDKDIPLFIMGNGSNLLVGDRGMRGIVLKIASRFSETEIDDNNIKVQTGILLSTLAHRALESKLSGLEFAHGIPGTLGGAIFMNAGAYGGEIKDIAVDVTCVNLDGDIVRIEGDGLEFGYRSSKVQKDNLIALEATLNLRYGDPAIIKENMDYLMSQRREKQPLSYPSGGSTFKRPEGHYAGKLIQDAGLKGYRIGDAKVSTKHAGFIINLGNATCKDVLNLIDFIQTRVYEKFQVELSPELRVVGEL
ncbi:MAG: UDP-N-acetylmuramate dehydrogenase [Clostridiales bacterium]|nr:UDP-N-acetylmuramate dehydrogenase [Clostridiales bacterium]